MAERCRSSRASFPGGEDVAIIAGFLGFFSQPRFEPAPPE
jgi:hypothetical protein